jgi:Mrp family chromosome partitioning ATPase
MKSAVAALKKLPSPRVVLVTCASGATGLSRASAALARAFAATGESTLAVDARPRVPRLHRRFGFRLQPGLANAAAGALPLEHAIRGAVPGAPHVLTAGFAENTSGAAALLKLIQEASGSHACTIINAAPLEELDLTAWRYVASAAVVVVRVHCSEEKSVREAIKMLRNSRIEVAGVVINELEPGVLA